jgi:20S proteasome alpha/beta subunit
MLFPLVRSDGTTGLLARLFCGTTSLWLVGSGAVYSFDPVGSYEREACRAAGAAQSLVQPFLDNQVRVLSLEQRVSGSQINLF